MAIFLTSDTHFGDPNVLKYRYRPFNSVIEMDTTIVALWNQRIHINDIVYHLGDFAVTDEDVHKYANILNGKINLIIGNHDYSRKEILSQYFNVIEEPMILEYNKRKLFLCHYPLQRHENLYTATGHVHNLMCIAKRMINVGVDCNHFRPIPIEQVFESEDIEKAGYWDANVYPDADLDWQWEVSTKISRDSLNIEPTMGILKEKMMLEGRDIF